MVRRVGAALLLLAAAAALTACASNAGGGSASSDPVGTWGDPDANGEPSLVLTNDGKLTGTDGCNQLSGSWSEDDGTITFGELASTRMFCEDVDDWLSKANTAKVDDKTMTVYGPAGKKIGTLDRE
jgi:heat shock protein HslJ